MAPSPPASDPMEALRARFATQVSDVVDADLPSLWAAVMLRMRDRGLIRGHGSIPGELAEAMMAGWYGGTLASQSTAHFDVETPLRRRIQVKALRYTDPRRASVGSFARPIAFDELSIVRFEYDMRPRDALLIDADLLRRSDAEGGGLLTPAGMRLSLGPRLLRAAEVVDAESLLVSGGGVSRDRSKAMTS